LPTRFSDLNKEIWKEALMQSWRDVLDELEGSIEKVVAKGAGELKLAIPSAMARAEHASLDNTLRAVCGLEERTIDGSNLRNSGSRCPDRAGRRTK
jgi:seryl-tRNA(Sec) selenium transferase